MSGVECPLLSSGKRIESLRRLEIVNPVIIKSLINQRSLDDKCNLPQTVNVVFDIYKKIHVGVTLGKPLDSFSELDPPLTVLVTGDLGRTVAVRSGLTSGLTEVRQKRYARFASEKIGGREGGRIKG